MHVCVCVCARARVRACVRACIYMCGVVELVRLGLCGWAGLVVSVWLAGAVGLLLLGWFSCVCVIGLVRLGWGDCKGNSGRLPVFLLPD